MKKIFYLFLISCTALCPNAFGTYAFEKEYAPTKSTTTSNAVSISGFGLLGNIRLKRTLTLLEPIDRNEITINSAYLEDALWILAGELNSQGYAKPQFTVKLYKGNELLLKTNWRKSFSPAIPDNLVADRVKIKVKEGDLDYYNNLIVTGIPSFLSNDEIDNYFYPARHLYKTEENKFFTKKRLKKSIQNLLERLKQEGYQNARLASEEAQQNKEDHTVDIKLDFDAGPQFYVNSALIIRPGEAEEITSDEIIKTQVYNNTWLLEFIQKIRAPYLRAGYPNTHVETKTIKKEIRKETAWIDLEFNVFPGEKIQVGHVIWQDNQGKAIDPLSYRCKIEQGSLLNIFEAQEEQDRLYGLNIFENIELQYIPTNKEGIWDILYICTPLDPYSIHLLAGWGSYEMLRVGFEFEHYNLLNMAHNGRLRTIQSFKSTQINYRYNIPNFQGRRLNVFAELEAFEREEQSHTDKRYGPSVGVDFLWKRYEINTSILFKYEILEVKKQQFLGNEGRNKSEASAFEFAFTQSNLDNALYPSKGYQWFARIETAIPYLGGNVSYERIELGGAYHKNLGSGLILHTGLKTGTLFSPEKVKDNVPISKRFRLGGENSIRGYQQGEAASKDKDGKFVGDEAYTLINMQLEQKILPSVSIVAFTDAAGITKQISQYPLDEILVSVGLGLSYNTIVGPLRVEYGYNVKKRTGDPSGTLHFSVGAPF